MVRGWSYLNQLNWVFIFSLAKAKVGLINQAVNSTMYLRKSYPTMTNILRKKWSRRVHVNNTLFLLNPLISWSNDYRFYRNYNKFLTYQHLFNSSIISFNFNSLLGKKLSKLNTLVSTSALNKGPLVYFTRRFNSLSRLSFLLTYSNSSWSFTSINIKAGSLNLSDLATTQIPIGVVSNSNIVPLNLSTNVHFLPSQLMTLHFTTTLSWVTSLYSTLIKLLFFKLV